MTHLVFPLRRKLLAILAGPLALLSFRVQAQTPPETGKPTADAHSGDAKSSSSERPDFTFRYPADWVIKTYPLHNVAQQNDANEILVALRNNVSPAVHVFLVSQGNTIVLYAPPDQQRLAASLITDLDRPRPSYKLTYTLTESDGVKRVGTQHYTMIVVAGQRTTLKQGSKIPLLAGTSSATANASAPEQFQYLDVGMNFNAAVDPYAGGVRLNSKVEQSSTTEDKAISGISEPIIRQTVLEGTAILTLGKPASLGTLEVPGTTRRIDIEVTADPIP